MRREKNSSDVRRRCCRCCSLSLFFFTLRAKKKNPPFLLELLCVRSTFCALLPPSCAHHLFGARQNTKSKKEKTKNSKTKNRKEKIRKTNIGCFCCLRTSLSVQLCVVGVLLLFSSCPCVRLTAKWRRCNNTNAARKSRFVFLKLKEEVNLKNWSSRGGKGEKPDSRICKLKRSRFYLFSSPCANIYVLARFRFRLR